jgi:hypothetical protein
LQLQFGHNLHITAQQKLKLKPGNCELNGQPPKKHGQKHSTTTANSSFALVAVLHPATRQFNCWPFFLFKKNKIK